MVERCVMRSPPDLREAILAAWRTNNRITLFLFEHLPPGLWAATVPGAPRRTIRMIAGHIHNARCMWIKVLGEPHGLPVPPSVNRHRVGARQLLPALRRSGNGITRLLQLGCQHGGTIPATRSYVWRNLPLDGSVSVLHELRWGRTYAACLELGASGYRRPTCSSGEWWAC